VPSLTLVLFNIDYVTDFVWQTAMSIYEALWAASKASNIFKDALGVIEN
jgi:hypothetical protein